MLYLIAPPRTMWWADLPTSLAIEIASRTSVANFSTIWDESERVADDAVLHLALRHGVPSSRGIVVTGAALSDPNRIRTLRENAVELHKSMAVLAEGNAARAAVIPGWGSFMDPDLDRRVDEAARAAIRLAIDDLREDIESHDLDPALVTLWEALGGRVPAPLVFDQR